MSRKDAEIAKKEKKDRKQYSSILRLIGLNMKITNLKVKNIRNYPSLDLDITSDMVVLSGPNAVGKTNLLESVYFGSLFKSFRDDAEFIFLQGTNNSEIKITLETAGSEHLLEIFLEKRDRIYANFKIDGVCHSKPSLL